MAKKQSITNPAFQKRLESSQKFNLVSQANPFNSIFEAKPLDDKTRNALDRLMLDAISPESANEEQVRADLEELKNITLEVKAIEKQGILLVGERLFKAREILGRWAHGGESFRTWLNIVFKQRSSAYNILAYYDLYKTLPNPELKNKLKEMPHKAAYVLASRKGEIGEKADIVEKYFEMKADEIIAIVQDAFPSSKKEARASASDILIDRIRTSLRKLISKKRSLKAVHFSAISECETLFQALLKANPEALPPIEISTNEESTEKASCKS